MISTNNPIHRLSEIDERLTQITMALAPAYAAIDLLGTDDNQIDVTVIETHPVFGPLWTESQTLKSEQMKINMDRAIEWEITHPATRNSRIPLASVV